MTSYIPHITLDGEMPPSDPNWPMLILLGLSTIFLLYMVNT